MSHEQEPGADVSRLAPFRPYLQMLARMAWDWRLGAKLDPSDVVQETLLEAQRNLKQFQGTTDAELAVWLRRILANELAQARRTFRQEKRDLSREHSCGDADTGVTVSGTVTRNGQTVDEARILFTPAKGMRAQAVGGAIKDGRYRIEGLKQVQYVVTVEFAKAPSREAMMVHGAKWSPESYKFQRAITGENAQIDLDCDGQPKTERGPRALRPSALVRVSHRD